MIYQTESNGIVRYRTGEGKVDARGFVFITYDVYDPDGSGRKTRHEYHLSPKDFITLILVDRAELLENLNMTEAEKKFADYFMQGYNRSISVQDMPYEKVEEWVAELEDIIFTAKATLQGVDKALRERRANLKESERQKIREKDSTINVSDAINSVNKRKDRLNKVEKLEENYRKLGFDEATIKELLKNVKVKEDIGNVISFNSGKNKDINEIAAELTESLLKEKKAPEPFVNPFEESKPVAETPKVEAVAEEKKPEPTSTFDPTALFG